MRTYLLIGLGVMWWAMSVITTRKVWREVNGRSWADLFASTYLGIWWPLVWALEFTWYQKERKTRRDLGA